MSEQNERLQDIPKDIHRSARSLARMTNLQVGIGYDASITVGNVTFNKYMVTDSTCAAEDLAMLVDYYSDEGYAEEGLTPAHVMFSISPADEPGLEGWDKQCLIEIKRPENFAKIITPPSKTAKAINRLLFGYGRFLPYGDVSPDMPLDGPEVTVSGGGEGPLFTTENQAKLDAGWDELMAALEKNLDNPPSQG